MSRLRPALLSTPRSWLLAAGLLIAAVVAGYAAILTFPGPFFPHRFEHGRFALRSDAPLPIEWAAVIDDAERRLSASGFSGSDARFSVYVAHSPWRLWLFTRSTTVGGYADIVASRNIFLRGAVPAENRILPPSGRLADARARPLSYFLAHEAAHITQSRRYGRWRTVRSPRWLVEGHADLVAKAGDFDVAANRCMLRDGHPFLTDDAARRGLYRRYHMMVIGAVAARGTVEALYADPPNTAEALAMAEALPAATCGRPQ